MARTRLLAPLAIASAGLLGRSVVDKLLVLRGGAGTVVAWGQMSSLLDLVVGVVAAGIGSGLAVLVSGADAPRRAGLLRAGMRGAAGLSAGIAAALLLGAHWRPDWAAALGVPASDIVFGAIAGIAMSFGSIAGSYWVGAQRLRLQGLLASAGAALAVLAAWLAPVRQVVVLLAGVQAALALAVAAWTLRRVRPQDGAPALARGELVRYVPAGLALGVLGPASMLAARSLTEHALSWQGAGSLQALWRVSDWVTSIAAGVLSVCFLPRLGAAWGTPDWSAELRAAAWAVLPASAIAFALLFMLRVPVFEALYGPGFVPSPNTAALFFAGSLLRVAAWVPLFALYAQGRARAIALGEFASLPLFAALLAAGAARAGLAWVAAAWLTSYAAYGALNLALVLYAGPRRR